MSLTLTFAVGDRLRPRIANPQAEFAVTEFKVNGSVANFKKVDRQNAFMEHVRTGLRNIMADLLRSRPAEEAVILAWPMVCGKEVAERARAVTFAEGVLTVEVSDLAWREQLGAFAPRYVSGFNELLGPLVKEVRFIVSH